MPRPIAGSDYTGPGGGVDTSPLPALRRVGALPPVPEFRDITGGSPASTSASPPPPPPPLPGRRGPSPQMLPAPGSPPGGRAVRYLGGDGAYAAGSPIRPAYEYEQEVAFKPDYDGFYNPSSTRRTHRGNAELAGIRVQLEQLDHDHDVQEEVDAIAMLYGPRGAAPSTPTTPSVDSTHNSTASFAGPDDQYPSASMVGPPGGERTDVSLYDSNVTPHMKRAVERALSPRDPNLGLGAAYKHAPASPGRDAPLAYPEVSRGSLGGWRGGEPRYPTQQQQQLHYPQRRQRGPPDGDAPPGGYGRAGGSDHRSPVPGGVIGPTSCRAGARAGAAPRSGSPRGGAGVYSDHPTEGAPADGPLPLRELPVERVRGAPLARTHDQGTSAAPAAGVSTYGGSHVPRPGIGRRDSAASSVGSAVNLDGVRRVPVPSASPRGAARRPAENPTVDGLIPPYVIPRPGDSTRGPVPPPSPPRGLRITGIVGRTAPRGLTPPPEPPRTPRQLLQDQPHPHSGYGDHEHPYAHASSPASAARPVTPPISASSVGPSLYSQPLRRVPADQPRILPPSMQLRRGQHPQQPQQPRSSVGAPAIAAAPPDGGDGGGAGEPPPLSPARRVSPSRRRGAGRAPPLKPQQQQRPLASDPFASGLGPPLSTPQHSHVDIASSSPPQSHPPPLERHTRAPAPPRVVDPSDPERASSPSGPAGSDRGYPPAEGVPATPLSARTLSTEHPSDSAASGLNETQPAKPNRDAYDITYPQLAAASGMSDVFESMASPPSRGGPLASAPPSAASASGGVTPSPFPSAREAGKSTGRRLSPEAPPLRAAQFSGHQQVAPPPPPPPPPPSAPNPHLLPSQVGSAPAYTNPPGGPAQFPQHRRGYAAGPPQMIPIGREERAAALAAAGHRPSAAGAPRDPRSSPAGAPPHPDPPRGPGEYYQPSPRHSFYGGGGEGTAHPSSPRTPPQLTGGAGPVHYPGHPSSSGLLAPSNPPSRASFVVGGGGGGGGPPPHDSRPSPDNGLGHRTTSITSGVGGGGYPTHPPAPAPSPAGRPAVDAVPDAPMQATPDTYGVFSNASATTAVKSPSTQPLGEMMAQQPSQHPSAPGGQYAPAPSHAGTAAPRSYGSAPAVGATAPPSPAGRGRRVVPAGHLQPPSQPQYYPSPQPSPSYPSPGHNHPPPPQQAPRQYPSVRGGAGGGGGGPYVESPTATPRASPFQRPSSHSRHPSPAARRGHRQPYAAGAGVFPQQPPSQGEQQQQQQQPLPYPSANEGGPVAYRSGGAAGPDGYPANPASQTLPPQQEQQPYAINSYPSRPQQAASAAPAGFLSQPPSSPAMGAQAAPQARVPQPQHAGRPRYTAGGVRGEGDPWEPPPRPLPGGGGNGLPMCEEPTDSGPPLARARWGSPRHEVAAHDPRDDDHGRGGHRGRDRSPDDPDHFDSFPRRRGQAPRAHSSGGFGGGGGAPTSSVGGAVRGRGGGASPSPMRVARGASPPAVHLSDPRIAEAGLPLVNPVSELSELTPEHDLAVMKHRNPDREMSPVTPPKHLKSRTDLAHETAAMIDNLRLISHPGMPQSQIESYYVDGDAHVVVPERMKHGQPQYPPPPQPAGGGGSVVNVADPYAEDPVTFNPGNADGIYLHDPRPGRTRGAAPRPRPQGRFPPPGHAVYPEDHQDDDEMNKRLLAEWRHQDTPAHERPTIIH